MQFFEEIILEEDIMIPAGTEMAGGFIMLDKDRWLEKGDKVRMHPSGFITVYSMSSQKASNILHKQFGQTIWNACKLAKHIYKSVVPTEEQIEEELRKPLNSNKSEETKIINLNSGTENNDKP